MLALTTVVAIAVTCSVVFLVSAIVIIIVWVKIRQERLSIAVAKARQGPYGHNPQSYPAETLTELSREEGSALRQYGQLPYGRPTEWGLLASRETLASQENLVQPSLDKESSVTLPEKTSALSLLQSRSHRSKRQSKTAAGQKHLSTLIETSEISPTTSSSKDEISVSAVDGVWELPTETTPRQTPEREEEQPKADTTMRPISGAFPVAHRRERSGPLFPVFEDHYESFDPNGYRTRGGSITSQSPGAAPEQPVPPPPCAYPPNRFRLSKNDSMRFSSLSLETADSSILEDGGRTPTNMDGSLTTPALPPCPTFAPFSANDVGRMEYDRNTFVTPDPFIFPTISPTYAGQTIEADRHSPRRSLTARSPTHSLERVSPPPRRSESLYTRQSKGDSTTPYLDLNRIPPLNTVGRSTPLLPHFSQMQRHSMHGSPRRENDPFYGGTANTHYRSNNFHAAGRRPNSYSWQETSSQYSNNHTKAPLPSALKGGSGPRKGHRRQNCVRISIHPPITFGGPTFSPMAEEPEGVEEFELHRSEISDLSTSNMSRNSSVSAMSTSRSSLQDFHRPNSRVLEISDAPLSGVNSRSPSGRKQQGQPDYRDSTNGNLPIEKTLPEILTSLPTTIDEGSLSHTPSPEKDATVWMASSQNGSPSRYENSPVPGSPRRSVVMGPRSQPGKPGRNSHQSLVPLEGASETGSPERRPRAANAKPQQGRQTNSLNQCESQAQGRSVPQVSKRDPLNKPQQLDRQPPPYEATKNQNPHNGIIVPIWEDKHPGPVKRKSTISLVKSEPADLQGDMSSRAIDHSKGHSQADRMARMASYRKSQARQELTTPTKKPIGLGIGTATPGSLYDGDGFLKE